MMCNALKCRYLYVVTTMFSIKLRNNIYCRTLIILPACRYTSDDVREWICFYMLGKLLAYNHKIVKYFMY